MSRSSRRHACRPQRQRRVRSCAVALGVVVGAALSTLGTQLAHAESGLLRPSGLGWTNWLDGSWLRSWQPGGPIDWAPDWPATPTDVGVSPHTPEA